MPPGAIYAKIVEKCGTRKYWNKWAEDFANVFHLTTESIERMLNQEDAAVLKEWFSEFHEELRSAVNDAITEKNAHEMLALHIVMKPVFEAIFEEYDFANRNPIAKALESLHSDFIEYGLEDETKRLALFYESVSDRIKGIDNSAGRQKVLRELYENFFKIAFKKDADRLGIVTTPEEVVDFILHSADDILRSEFGRTLSDENVQILDPFTGTGLFLARLLQLELIRDEDLERKFQQELYANDLLPLAYYIAAVNIEEAYRGRLGEAAAYVPFEGIVLTDTFNLSTDRQGVFPYHWLKENADRLEKQQTETIQVIVGNPPWSAGQSNAADEQPKLRLSLHGSKRIRETYSAQSTVSKEKVCTIPTRWRFDGRPTGFKNAESPPSLQAAHGSKATPTPAYGHASPTNSALFMS